MDQHTSGPVSPEMLVQEVLLRYPRTLAVFRRHGFPCPRCMASVYENVAQVATMLAVDLPDLLADLNEAAAAGPELTRRLPYGREPSAN